MGNELFQNSPDFYSISDANTFNNVAAACTVKVDGGALIGAGSSTKVDNVAKGVKGSPMAGSQMVKRTTTVLTPNNMCQSGATTWATMTAGSYVMMGGSCVKIAGDTNNILRSSAAPTPSKRRSIAKVEAIRSAHVATAIRGGFWNPQTNAFDSGYPETAGSGVACVTGGAAQHVNGQYDHAALPTAAKPGELVFKGGSLTPVTTGYSAKTTW